MKNYKQLSKEFDKKVKKLQKQCKHSKTTIMERWWAIGHSCGYQVEVCDICNLILRRIYPKLKENEKQETVQIFSKVIKVQCQNFGCTNDVEVKKNCTYYGIICSECQQKTKHIYTK